MPTVPTRPSAATWSPSTAPAALMAATITPQLGPTTWSIVPDERDSICHAFLVTHGQGSFTWNEGVVVGLGAPALLWLPRGACGLFRLEAGSQGSTCAVTDDVIGRAVGGSAMQAELKALADGVALAASDRLAAQLDEIDMIFAALVRESRADGPGVTTLTGFYLGLLLLHLWRWSSEPPATDQRGGAQATVRRFRQLIDLHYGDNLGVAEFARRLGVTRSHLHAACLKATDRTPLALLHDRLLREARIRLEQTDLPVEQIGYGLGFRDAGYFSRFFKRRSGMAPGAYRRTALLSRSVDDLSFAAWP